MGSMNEAALAAQDAGAYAELVAICQQLGVNPAVMNRIATDDERMDSIRELQSMLSDAQEQAVAILDGERHSVIGEDYVPSFEAIMCVQTAMYCKKDVERILTGQPRMTPEEIDAYFELVRQVIEYGGVPLEEIYVQLAAPTLH